MLSGFRPAAATDGERDGEGDPSTVRGAELLADAAAASTYEEAGQEGRDEQRELQRRWN
jgi:hypothetical protein